MERRNLDITIKRANGIKNVNFLSTMDVYAVLSISGDPFGKSKQKTHVHKDGGVNPHWNYSFKFSIDDTALQSNRLTLKIKLVSHRTLGDRKIGKVQIPIKQLFDESLKGGDDGKSERSVTYSVRTASGNEKGTVEFSFKIGEKIRVEAPPPPPVKKAEEPMMAYPPQQGYHGSTSAYPGQPAYPYPPPPPQHGYGYAPAPQPGYGYPPAQPGYGYPQPVYQTQKPKRNGMGGGGGMALGLGAGLLGGLLVGDMISDVGDYDAGGFDGGFDF